ncbi:MAG TPA: hypothetical protein VF771_02065 [Longimicrobiaceae bacterium]
MLDELEAAHAVVGGARRARAFARQQVNQAYVVLLASQFQRFCRDLYTEAVDHLLNQPAYATLEPVLRASLFANRRLNVGNANPSNIGADYGRFGVRFWSMVAAADPRNEARQRKIEELHRWRNAVAHADFSDPAFARRETLRMSEIRVWRSACSALAVEFDRVLGLHLQSITGMRPW